MFILFSSTFYYDFNFIYDFCQFCQCKIQITLEQSIRHTNSKFSHLYHTTQYQPETNKRANTETNQQKNTSAPGNWTTRIPINFERRSETSIIWSRLERPKPTEWDYLWQCCTVGWSHWLHVLSHCVCAIAIVTYHWRGPVSHPVEDTSVVPCTGTLLRNCPNRMLQLCCSNSQPVDLPAQ